MNMGGWEWVILALIALLLFGGSRLAGFGKNAGKSIREFREETAMLRTAGSSTEPAAPAGTVPAASAADAEATTDTKS